VSTLEFGDLASSWLPVEGRTFRGFIESDAVPAEARNSVAENCVRVLSQGQPPGVPGNRTGLVLGRVQSGKTMSFTGAAALARDNRFPLVIVLAGTKNNLVGQTSSRFQEDLGLDSMHPLFPDWRALAFTTRTPSQELVDAFRHAVAQDEDEPPTVLVTLLKAWRNVTRLAEILETLDARLAARLGSASVLVIDDEADEASLNAARVGRPPTATYSAIRRLRAALPSHTYLQYTATPQALLLLGLLDQLSPDFVHLLEPGPDYCGGPDFFGPEATSRHVRPIPNGEVAAIRTGALTTRVPPSLYRAIVTYVCSVALEVLSGVQPTNRSMLVHPHVARDVQRVFDDWVRNVKAGIERMLTQSPHSTRTASFWRQVDDATADICGTANVAPPDRDELRKMMQRILRNTSVLRMNSDTLDEPNWRQQFSLIAIGGNKLQRGYTLEGLNTTWMPRSPGQNQVDTVLQRGRFFGYRRPYLDFCRVFLADDLRQSYEQIVPHELALWEALETQIGAGVPLTDWRRAMLLDPGLRACRASVVRLPTNRAFYGISPEWFSQQRDEGTDAAANRPLLDAFEARLTKLRRWPDSSDWTQDQMARYQVLTLREVMDELLVPWKASERESMRLWALRFQLGSALDIANDEPCVVVKMNSDALDRATRTISEGAITQLAQGRNSRTGYPGDNQLHSPPDPMLAKWEGVTTVRLYRLDLHEGQAQRARSDVPFIAVRPPARLAQPWLLQV
jgi:hypothetical protein